MIKIFHSSKKKILFITFLIIVNLFLIINSVNAADANSSFDDPIKFSLGHCTPDDSLAGKNAKMFKNFVEEMSEGSILIDIYPMSQLGTEPTMMDSVYSGTLDMALISTTVLTTIIDELNALLLPFLFNDLEAIGNVINSDDFYNETAKIVETSTGMHFIGVPVLSARGLLNKKRPVTNLEDMKDLTIRIIPGNIIYDIFEAMNVSTTQLSFGEVYTALQQGVIDGVENGIPDCIEMKFVEVGKYYSDTLQCINTMPILMSDLAWNKLSAEQQEIIRDAAKKVEMQVVDITNETIEASYKIANEEYNVEITKLNSEMRANFKKACQPVYDKYIPIIGEDYYNLVNSLAN